MPLRATCREEQTVSVGVCVRGGSAAGTNTFVWLTMMGSAGPNDDVRSPMAPSTAKIANDDSTRREQHHAPARVREHAPLALPSPLSPSVAPPSSSSFSAPCAGVSAVCGTRTRVSVSSSAAAASSARRSTARSSSASRVVGPSVASPPSGKPDTLSLIFVSDAKKKAANKQKAHRNRKKTHPKKKHEKVPRHNCLVMKSGLRGLSTAAQRQQQGDGARRGQVLCWCQTARAAAQTIGQRARGTGA